MVVVSYSGREINAKIVYYGPGLCGKTTNLERIYEAVPAANKGKMISMKTKADRTLFFDFLPLELGDVGGFRTRLMLYTVPGQVFYNATRKLVLKGVDALVFVADSERGKMQENRESLENLRENLESYGLDLDEIPLVFQYNKRDLPSVYTREELDQGLARGDRPMVESAAAKGEGVFETLRLVSELLLARLRARLGAPAGAPAKRETEAPVRSAAPAVEMGRPAPAPATGLAAPGAAPAALPVAPAPLPLRSAPTAPAPTFGVADPAMGPVELPPSAPRARIPLAEPLPVVRRPATGAEGNVPPGMAAPEPDFGAEETAVPRDLGWERSGGAVAPPATRPQLEIVRLDSAAREDGPEPVQKESEVPAAAPRAPRRIVVPIELDLDQVESGECVELVLRLEIGHLKGKRQVSG